MDKERVLEPAELSACGNVARALMTGTREGSEREAWRHAEEVAAAMGDVRAFLAEGELRFWQGVGWLHDVLEDCDGLDATWLTGELIRLGVAESRAEELFAMVRILTKAPGEVETYFQRIHECGIWQVAYIKVADRILNLQEGKTTLPRKRWAAMAQEARQHVIPLLNDLPEGMGSRLFFVLSFSMFRNKRRGRRAEKNPPTT